MEESKAVSTAPTAAEVSKKQQVLEDEEELTQQEEPQQKKQKQDDGETTTDETLMLTWTNYNADDDSETKESMSVNDLVEQNSSLGSSRAVEENEAGEWQNRYFHLELVDTRDTEKKDTKKDNVVKNGVLASLSFVWWENSSYATLMNFNQMSQDLAEFCRDLWIAAGRPKNQYSDFGIEMGRSPHSSVEVNELIGEVYGSSDKYSMELTYLDVGGRRGTPVKDKAHSARLMNGLLELLRGESTVITHSSDLATLNVDSPEAYGFRSLRGQGFFIRPATG